jgi:hypothetical protein
MMKIRSKTIEKKKPKRKINTELGTGVVTARV